MNEQTNEQRITIEHRFSDESRITIEANRKDKEVEITQWIDHKCYSISLGFDEAYKLMELLKTAMEVKL